MSSQPLNDSSSADWLDEIIHHTTGCGSNADPADGFGYCTCGAEEQKAQIAQHVQEAVVAARIDELERLYNQKRYPTATKVIFNEYYSERIAELTNTLPAKGKKSESE